MRHKSKEEYRAWYKDEYLTSWHWREQVTPLVKQRSKGVCEHCDMLPAQHIHHRKDAEVNGYKYLWREHENLEVLLHVCESCHRHLHGKSQFNPRRYYQFGGEAEILKLMREMGL